MYIGTSRLHDMDDDSADVALGNVKVYANGVLIEKFAEVQATVSISTDCL